MVRWARLACLFALVSGSSPALADIDPPKDLEWLPERRIAIENFTDFPDWVFVSWPCNDLPQRAFAWEPYCVIRDTEGDKRADIDMYGSLYALAARDTTVVYEPKGGLHGQPAWMITKPQFSHKDEIEVFFKNDRRVVRSEFQANVRGLTSVPIGVGLQRGVFWVHIDGVDEKGIRAHYSRVTWTCKSGDAIELEWDASKGGPPLPACPALGTAQVLGELPASLPPPERDRRPLLLGLAIAGASLLVGGFLLKREAKASR